MADAPIAVGFEDFVREILSELRDSHGKLATEILRIIPRVDLLEAHDRTHARTLHAHDVLIERHTLQIADHSAQLSRHGAQLASPTNLGSVPPPPRGKMGDSGASITLTVEERAEYERAVQAAMDGMASKVRALELESVAARAEAAAKAETIAALESRNDRRLKWFLGLLAALGFAGAVLSFLGPKLWGAQPSQSVIISPGH